MSDERVAKITALLKKEYTDIRTALNFTNPLELLVATVLSAQSTDRQVNGVTKNLFKKYTTPEDYAKASLEELEKDIYSTGFYKNKAKNIQKMCEVLIENFEGEVPDNMKDLITLSGVARKTANVVLWNAFRKNEGIAVDTHVKRVAARLGLTANTNPDKIEKDLMKIIPKEDWGVFSLLLIRHGREICIARKPRCKDCILNRICPSAFTFG